MADTSKKEVEEGERKMAASKPYKLASREFRQESTVVKVGNIGIGRGGLTIIAGPCAVETEEQLLLTAWEVSCAGGHILRGGAYKPRTSPHSFQGLEEEGLKLLAKAREKTGLPIVTEVMASEQVAMVAKYADMLQIGTRSMQNFPLLKAVGSIKKPVLLKRGFGATYEEWLGAAEYILQGGNDQVVLCERGIRTFETGTRFTLDLAAVPMIKELSHLPIIVDPSHGTGKTSLVAPMAMAAVAAGADGIIVDVHPNPEAALCDGAQALTAKGFTELVRKVRGLAQLIDADWSSRAIWRGDGIHPPI